MTGRGEKLAYTCIDYETYLNLIPYTGSFYLKSLDGFKFSTGNIPQKDIKSMMKALLNLHKLILQLVAEIIAIILDQLHYTALSLTNGMQMNSYE
jgi:hypothetical protein